MNSIKIIVFYIRDLPTRCINFIKFRRARVNWPRNSIIRGRINIVNRGSVIFGENCTINAKDKYVPLGYANGCNFIAEKGADISIGKHVGITNASIYSRQSITIGDNVMVGSGTKIYDTDFHSLDFTVRGTTEDKACTISKPVIIGDNVFIGAGSLILKGVRIGDKSIIGAGSVVTKNVPSGEIWAGNPAKFIRTL